MAALIQQQFNPDDLDKESRLVRTSRSIKLSSTSSSTIPHHPSLPNLRQSQMSLATSDKCSSRSQISLASNTDKDAISLALPASFGCANNTTSDVKAIPPRQASQDNESDEGHAEEDEVWLQTSKTAVEFDPDASSRSMEGSLEHQVDSVVESALKERREMEEEIETQFRKTMNSTDLENSERQCARDYILVLLQLLPSLFEQYSASQVDEALINFASNFCTEHASTGECLEPQRVIILNADAVYVTSYAALLLNMKFLKSNYYDSQTEPNLVMTEKEFIDSVMGCGLLLYLSEAWLSEVYRLILEKNYLGMAGYRSTTHSESAFHSVISDLDGLGARIQGGQFITEFRIPQATDSAPDSIRDPRVLAGRRLAKCLMVTCWEGLLDTLAVMLTERHTPADGNVVGQLALLLGTEGAKEESRRAREAVIQCLEGLQSAARLSSLLLLQNRCGAVFDQLTTAACQLDHRVNTTSGGSGISLGVKASTESSSTNKLLSDKLAQIRLHASHALSLDVVLSRGLEMGSHSSDCWRHVFRACVHIARLERIHFASSRGGGGGSMGLGAPFLAPSGDLGNRINLGDDMMSDTGYSDAASHTTAPSSDPSISRIIEEAARESAWETSRSGVLTAGQTKRVLCSLTHLIDALFETAASRLTLDALIMFLKALCRASTEQLASISSGARGNECPSQDASATSALLLDRVSEVMLSCIRGNRPLYHLLRLWSCVSPHFTEVCCHRDASVSRRGVSSLHECIIAVLSLRTETLNFHVNEALCKPIENLLCLEMCDGDVQDQIVCCICELVEACSTEIRSGWRPLFGALRAVKIEFTASEEINEARQRHVNAVLDVFQVFLSTDNVQVFTNAAVDCILCLLKYIKGPTELMREMSDSDSDDSDTDVIDVVGLGDSSLSGSDSTASSGSLCLPALRYLHRCCQLLASMWLMPACPKFKSTHRLSTVSPPSRPFSPEIDMTAFLHRFPSSHLVLPEITVNNLATSQQHSPDKETGATLDQLDNSSHLLRVWFMLLDGLGRSVTSCPRKIQPSVLHSLMEMIGSTRECPGPQFTVYLANHMLLPRLQAWTSERHCNEDRPSQIRKLHSAEANIRQACGLVTDLVSDLIIQMTSDKSTKEDGSISRMLEQTLDVLIECIAQPNEIISRLGSSCIRHLITTSGSFLTEDLWQVACRSLRKAIDVALYPLFLIMTPFNIASDQFYGDIGQVKVAARRDASSLDCERLRQLAQKVFLLECQHVQPASARPTPGSSDASQRVPCPPQVSSGHSTSSNVIDYTVEEMRNYVFLLYPADQTEKDREMYPENTTARVQFRGIVYGLLAHQLLLQTIGDILLAGSTLKAISDQHLISDSLPLSSNAEKETKMPGVLDKLSASSCSQLLHALAISYRFCSEFDRRPGLKFLLQRVCHSRVAANLYKQTGVAAAFLQHTLLEISRRTKFSLADAQSALNQSKLFSVSGIPDLLDLADNADWMAAMASSSDKGIKRDSVMEKEEMFLRLLARTFASLTHSYLTMLSDKSTIELSDKLSEQPIFLLAAQPEDLGEARWSRLDSVGRTQRVIGVQLLTLGEHKTTGKSSKDSKETQSSTSQRPVSTEDSKIYTIASESTIRNLMTEYKRHKLQNSLPPPRSQHSTPRNPTPSQTNQSGEVAAVRKEQTESLLRDSSARLLSCSHMLATTVQLALQLSDDQFARLLPALSPSMIALIGLAENPLLRQLLADWVARLGTMYKFTPTIDISPTESTNGSA